MVFFFEEGIDISIFCGDTLDCDRLYFKFCSRFNIKSFIKQKIREEKKFNIHVESFDNFLNKKNKPKLIICLRINEINHDFIEILKKHNLIYFRDYIFYFNFCNQKSIDFSFLCKFYKENELLDIFNELRKRKKLCFINGNHQKTLLTQYLLHNECFTNRYTIINIPELRFFSQNTSPYIDFLIKNCQLIISQNIPENNSFEHNLSSSYIKSRMEPNTQYIEISNLTFYGYFPQSYNAINNIAQIGKQRIFNYGDKNIINLIHQKVSMNEIKSILNDENFYSKNFLDTFFEEQLIIFYEQESSADIKMYDYLATNYNKNILFHAYNRPHKSLIKKLAQRLLRYLDFNDLTFKNEHLIDKENDLYYQSQAIYPSVLKYLNLSTKDTYYPNRYILDDDFNFNEYIETYINCYSTYSKVPITNKIRPTISIWGSCVSREIFNYTDRYKINIYILQNPIHTLNFKGLPLNPDIIQGSSNFTKKMCYLEFNKLAEKFFAKEKSDFLMIDTCDCRNFFYTLANDSTARISSSISSDMTIKKLIAENLYEEKFFKRISPFEISDSEWKQHVKYFCDTILRYYDKDRIILNKFNFAEYYLDKGRYIKFENFLFYKKLNILTKKIEFFIKDYLNDCILLKEVKSPVANKNHHIGCAPMHYTDDVYLHQVNQLDNIIS